MKKNMFMALAILLACQLGFTACKKNAVNAKNEKEAANVENQDKVLKFLSTVLAIPSSKIQIDHSTKEFYIPDTGFRIKISEISKKYDAANIYKAQYEK